MNRQQRDEQLLKDRDDILLLSNYFKLKVPPIEKLRKSYAVCPASDEILILRFLAMTLRHCMEDHVDDNLLERLKNAN